MKSNLSKHKDAQKGAQIKNGIDRNCQFRRFEIGLRRLEEQYLSELRDNDGAKRKGAKCHTAQCRKPTQEIVSNSDTQHSYSHHRHEVDGGSAGKLADHKKSDRGDERK